MAVLTYDGVLSQVTPLQALLASLGTLLLLALVYHDRPIGVRSARGMRGVLSPAPAYPLIGSLPLLIKIATRKSTMLTEMLKLQMGPAAGGKPFTLAWPAMGGRASIINNPGYIQHVQKTNFDNFPKGHLQRKHFGDVLGVHGIFVADGAPWFKQRKLAAHIFSVSNFNTHVQDSVHNDLRKLDSLLRDAAKFGHKIALPDLFFRFTLSSFSKMAFDADVGCMPLELKGLDVRNTFADNFDFAQSVMENRFMQPTPRWFELFTEQGRRMRAAIKVLHEYCYSIIDARLAKGASEGAATDKSGKDLLDLFRDQGLTREELLPVILNFLIAGRDTTAQSLSWMFLELQKSPQHFATIRKEVAEVLGTGEDQRMMAYEDVKAMPFLQACYYEAIRLWPSVPKNVKLVAGDDVVVAGDAATIQGLPPIHVKKGETVAWSDWVMARMPEVWGPDCKEFKPERFLTQTGGGDVKAASTTTIKNFSQWQFHSFNGGPRLCLGKSLATYEGMAVAAAIVGRYDVLYDEKTLRENPPVFTDSVTLPCTPYYTGFKVRST
ncbi:unnamed protein product [Parajaminaea phylloscopi]